MTTEMYDSIDPAQIPPGADAAGYVDGRWRTVSQLSGHSHVLSIAVFASDDADAIDDEPGDATDAELPGWVAREDRLGHWRPVCYFSVAHSGGAARALQAGGVDRASIRVWTAHYTYRSHLCDAGCGLDPWFATADATQWTDRSGGRNLDESTVADDFWGPVRAPDPTPPPAPDQEVEMFLMQRKSDAAQAVTDGVRKVYVPDGDTLGALEAKLGAPVIVSDVFWNSVPVERVSGRLLLWLCDKVGTPACVGLFFALAVIGFPVHDLRPVPLVQWLSQSCIQLVMLAVLQFAANQAKVAHAETKAHLTRHGAHLERIEGHVKARPAPTRRAPSKETPHGK